MKCNAWVVDRTSLESGKIKVIWAGLGDGVSPTLEELRQAFEAVHHSSLYSYGPTRRCGGKIISNVGIQEEPHYGGVSCELRIEFKCKQCDNRNHAGLEDCRYADRLNEMITRWIEEEPDVA